MAIYFNLGIDCGPSLAAASRVESHFQSFKIISPNVNDVECEVHREQTLGHWFVAVWPQGLGYATRVHRPELLPHEEEIAAQLLTHLSKLSDYRRAIFGAEAYEILACGSREELNDIDYAEMIYSEEEFPNGPSSHRQIEPFAKGFSIVKK